LAVFQEKFRIKNDNEGSPPPPQTHTRIQIFILLALQPIKRDYGDMAQNGLSTVVC